jgi:hypothetical protein
VCFGFDRKSSTSVVGQAQAFLPKLFAQDAVFLDEVIDYLLLAAVNPTGQNGDDKLKQHAVHRAEYTVESVRNVDSQRLLDGKNRGRLGQVKFWHTTGFGWSDHSTRSGPHRKRPSGGNRLV